MVIPVLVPILPFAAPAPAPDPGRDRESVAVFRATKSGRILPLPDIEARVVPKMKGAQYIGFSLEMPSGIYTLKFLKDGDVIWVDVDGRSGQVLGRTDK